MILFNHGNTPWADTKENPEAQKSNANDQETNSEVQPLL